MSEPFGQIYYLELPSRDIAASAAFYNRVFGWNIRTRDDGVTAFDDSTGHVSGMWSASLPIADEPGLRVYIGVNDAVAVSEAIEAAGGTIVLAADPSVVDIVVQFRDPSGNLLCLHQYNPDAA